MSLVLPLNLTQVRRDVIAFRLGHRPTLDGVRALAVLLVLIHHVEFITPLTYAYLPGGFLGVDLFFVLSGFLITSLLIEEFNGHGLISLSRFYMRRALRLLPAVGAALLVSLVAGLIVGFESIGMTPLRTASIFFYFTNWVRAFETPELWLLAHFWSLAIEEQFYLVWPVVLFSLLRRGIGHRKVVIIVSLAALGSIAWMTFLWSHRLPVLRVYSGSDTRGHTLLIGCLLALVLQWGFIPSTWARNNVVQLLGYFSLVLFLLASLWLQVGDPFLYRGGFALVAICAAGLILSVLFSKSGFIHSVMTHQIALWLGKRSYGLYVWHWPIYFLLGKIGGSAFILKSVAIVLTLGVAALSYRFIESPFLKMKLRYAAR